MCAAGAVMSVPSSVNCNAGFLIVQARVSAAIRSVRLTLSDGRAITSRVFSLPARLGRGAGVFFQALRGPLPIPVSLAGLDSRGRVVSTTTLPRIVECTAQPLHFLPHGIKTLVVDRIPGGPEFSIIGERYRFLGNV